MGSQNVSSYREVFNDGDVVDLADNSWHQVEIKKNNSTTLILYVDIAKKTIEVPGFYSTPSSLQVFYFGGIDDAGKKLARHRRRDLSYVKFLGCFSEKVKVHGFSIRDMIRSGNARIYGMLDFDCKEDIVYNPVTFSKPESFVKIKNVPERETAQYSFKFRTYNEVGLLLFQTREKADDADIIISLESGRVKLDVSFAKVSLVKSTLVTLHAGSTLYDGMWHSVSVRISIRSVTLKVDNERSIQNQGVTSSSERFVSSPEVIIGARDKDRPGFVGCMRDLSIQGQVINFTTVDKSQVAMGECSITDRCVPTPCKNGGRCTQMWNKTMCNCLGTDFEGSMCETPLIFMSTCADWWFAGKRRDNSYKINPPHSQPFLVYCNMSNIDGPSSVIYHRQDTNPTSASSGKLVDRKLYVHEIHYELAEMQSIKALIGSSTHCRQYLRYSCYNSVLFDSPHKFKVKLGRGARWASRDGQIQDYWPGASPGSSKCACGVNRTCAEPSKVCNCDTAGNEWRMDDGYLTDSNALPVKKIIFSVNGTSSKSFFVLGNLECFGSKTKRPTQTTTAKTPVPHYGFTTHLTTKRAVTAKAINNINQRKSPSTSIPRYYPTVNKSRQPTPIGSTATSAQRNTITESIDTSESISLSTAEIPTDNENESSHIIVIESSRKYITIRENASQDVVLIILSIILAIFVIAIVVLIVKQNVFVACKCLRTPLYQDVRRIDNIEIGPPTSMHGDAEPKILQFETSPYPTRNYDISLDDGCLASSSPEILSDAETDRLDFSNGSSSLNSENADIEKEDPPKENAYKDVDLGLLDVAPFTLPRQLNTDQQIEKLKEVILDVLSASEIMANHNEKKETTPSKIKNFKRNDPKVIVHIQPQDAADQPPMSTNEKSSTLDDSIETVSRISAESEPSLNVNSLKKYKYDEGTGLKRELDEESLREGTASETLDSRKTAPKKWTHGNWISYEPHDTYLSFDLDQIKEDCDNQTHETNSRSPRKDKGLNGQLLHGSNTKATCDEERCLQPTSDKTKLDALKSRKDDKRKRVSPRSRLFSRQRSEEEVLLSSTRSTGLNQNKNIQLPKGHRKRHSGISNAFCRMQQHHALKMNSDEHQSKDEPREGEKERSQKIIPTEIAHAQKYETEL